jgi:hypothetical protein
LRRGRACRTLGGVDVDRAVLQRTVSIVVEHRSGLGLVAERVG